MGNKLQKEPNSINYFDNDTIHSNLKQINMLLTKRLQNGGKQRKEPIETKNKIDYCASFIVEKHYFFRESKGHLYNL